MKHLKELIALAVTVSMTMNACAGQTDTQVATRAVDSSPTPSPEPAPSQTPMPSETIRSGYGGEASEAQKAYIDADPVYQDRVGRVRDYLDFLQKSTPKRFDPMGPRVSIIPVWSVDGTMAEPVIEVIDDDGKSLIFAVPFEYNSQIPVVEDGNQLTEGEGPLPLTGGEYQLGYDFELQTWIRYDLETGNTVDKVGKGNRWDSARFTREAVTKIPKSEAEITESCVRIASPIDAPDKYAYDMHHYLATVHEILESYNGPVLSFENGNLGVGPDTASILRGSELRPVACARFGYDGREVAMLTFAGQDSQGLFALNIIINPDYGEHPYRSVNHFLGSFPIIISGYSIDVASSKIDESRFTTWSNNFEKQFYATDRYDMRQLLDEWRLTGKFDRGSEYSSLLSIQYQK